MTGPEDLLSDALRQRADHHDVPTTPMSDVVASAGRIQRHRRIRYAAVTTVVVAVLATPFVIDAVRPQESSTGPIEPGPSPAPHFRLADVARGPDPSVPWLDGSVYVAADGTRTTLPVRDVVTATPYRGGFLVVGGTSGGDSGDDSGDDRAQVTLLDSGLDEVWRRCGQPDLVVNGDRTRTAFAAGPCRGTRTTLTLGPTDGVGEEWTESMPLELADPAGILGTSVVTSSFIQEQSLVVDFDGTPAPIDGLAYARDVDEQQGLVSGQLVDADGAEFMGAVVDAGTGDVRWRARDWQLASFSPDGSMVLGALDAGSDLALWGIFDTSTGERLHDFALPAGVKITRMVWEDDEHLLFAAFQGRTEALLRSTLDGAIQRASDAVRYDPDGNGSTIHLAP